MKDRIIIDTGPLVAFINRKDTYHEWSKQMLDTVNHPIYTCEAVISEACFLLQHINQGKDAILNLLSNKLLMISFSLQNDVAEISKLMKRYENIPMSIADACLVRMTELYPSRVITLDSDFQIYRKHGRQPIDLLT